MPRETQRDRAARELRRAHDYIDELERTVIEQRITIRRQADDNRELRRQLQGFMLGVAA